uniref:Uncharacterized protein C18orf8 n=1 Tax=Aceria tosichella TaxID=561515 RepID=A0A6G1SHH4_9ACAR
MRQASREASSSGVSGRSKGLAATSSQSSHHYHQKKAANTSKPNSLLLLKQNHATFQAPSKKESVFFDECNREIISLTRDFEQVNKTRVVFQRTEQISRVEFVLPIGKRILSIKLNSTRTVLAYHVERNLIEFINVREQLDSSGQIEYALDSKRYVQSSKAKNSKLVGFLWTGVNELVIITDLSVEFYHLDSARHRLNYVKMFQSSTNWFVYQPVVSTGLPPPASEQQPNVNCDTYSILMVSIGSQGNSMQPYMFSCGRILKLQRFDVEGNWRDSEKMELFERSITIAQIYGLVRLLVLQHESLNVRAKGAQIVLYTVNPDTGVTSKTHTLDLDVSGRFAINVLDNLVVAHDQPSKSSFIFDIMIEATEKSDCPSHFVSLIDSGPIKQLVLDDGKPVDMYSLNWVFFQPNFIVDAKLGLLTTLELDLDSLHLVFKDSNLMLQFLARRRNLENVIVSKCKEIVCKAHKQATSFDNDDPCSPIAEISSTFEQLAKLVISAPELPDSHKNNSKSNQNEYAHRREVEEKQQQHQHRETTKTGIAASIYQEDIQREIFRELEDNRGSDNHSLTSLDERQAAAHYHFVSSVLVEFVYVVRRHKKNVEFCIYEQLLRLLMRAGRHFQMVQMIRSEILKDSKQLACSLLSLKDQYHPAAQLGLDMLYRLTGGDLPATLPLECWARDDE